MNVTKSTSPLATPDASPKIQRATRMSSPPATFWSRHLTIINFWIDVFLLVTFMIQAWIIAVLQIVFPRGAGLDWKVWGATSVDWIDSLTTTFCIFAAAVVVHVMFHWTWVCAVISTRLLGRKAGKDDGSLTLIGVGTIVVLVHLLLVGVIAAKAGLRGPN